MNSDQIKNVSADYSEEPAQIYCLKVLFGPMLGCELHLPEGDYFLIIEPGLALQDKTNNITSEQQHAAHYTLNTLYIPCDKPSPNIILRLSNSLEEGGFRLELQDSAGFSTDIIEENKIFSHEHIHLALKRHDADWEEAITHFNLLPAKSKAEHEDNLQHRIKKRKELIFLIAFLLLAVLFIGTGILWYKKTEYNQQVLTLTEVLSGAPAPLQVVKGRDGKKIYVLAHNLPEMEWSTQAIRKMNESHRVIPIWLRQHGQDTIRRLFQAGYPVLQLDFNSPSHPVISLYRDPLPVEEKKLKSALLEYLPFYDDISITIKTKSQLLAEARQGLDRLHVPYRKIDTANGYALVVKDALSDSVLFALRDFIVEFNRKWGSNVINFSINLDENWLQNKSYVDSPDGYLFLNPRHWYFPLNKVR
ncbi:PrgH/EprH family type III secretion apparatus protein [Erwinia tracheiphila]|uniref:PrgH/EprH family type III secretion apparatus protein n=1 Tax=Erwinia tracheiphila TaxID=65700 RepID=A0A345CW30_9GAMM|nr:PrgH/EprH family type III secretion apparatus protein [Erwinia tracheiphila]AXF77647.1 PrgH/EprH family type III secretion apparatus protein [Erwinia tracheiphila]UIA83666.1 PrgH/EprH family type III secretion apparatus protein [Erwinia tracheiphila]UIA92248.1 PrgH/EprH family type III secretion apparatus protein [Erwinia tracheiphila]